MLGVHEEQKRWLDAFNIQAHITNHIIFFYSSLVLVSFLHIFSRIIFKSQVTASIKKMNSKLRSAAKK